MWCVPWSCGTIRNFGISHYHSNQNTYKLRRRAFSVRLGVSPLQVCTYSQAFLWYGRGGVNGMVDLLLRSTTVLIVDDDPAIVKLCRSILVARGCRVLTAESAADAIQV